MESSRRGDNDSKKKCYNINIRLLPISFTGEKHTMFDGPSWFDDQKISMVVVWCIFGSMVGINDKVHYFLKCVAR